MKAIFYDSNFFIKKSKKPFDDFFNLLEQNGYESFICRIVIDEIKANNRRDINELIETIEKASNSYLTNIYFSNAINLKNIEDAKPLDNSDSRCDYYFSKYFKDHIIENDSENEMMKILMNRDKEKIPPFCSGESDKGWKDTLIWTGMINYCTNHKFDEVLFATKDKFDGNRTKMAEEFYSETGSSIIFLDVGSPNELLKFLKIEDDSKENKKSDEVPFNQSVNNELDEESIKKCKSVIEAFTKTNVVGDLFEESHYSYNFEFYDLISNEQVENFCNAITEDRDLFDFYDSISFDRYFIQLHINGKTKIEVPYSVFIDFTAMWKSINENYPDYKQKVIMRLWDEFSKMYKDNNSNEDEPPF